MIDNNQNSQLEQARLNANKFYMEGIKAFDQLLIGERQAKMVILTGLVMGDNVLLVGEPGGGKSTLVSHAHEVVNGINPEDIANVPHRSDLTALELVGGSISSTKEIETADSKRSETTTATVQSIIKPSSKVIVFDEVNRTSPLALNAALGILQNHTAKVGGKSVEVNGLDLVVSTMNPSETRQATHQLPAAFISRQALGAVLGAKSGWETQIDGLWNGWKAQPKLQIERPITVEELHDVRHVIDQVVVSESLRNAGKELTINTLGELQSLRVIESAARIAKQILRTAQALALMHGETQVQEKELQESLSYVITARLGAQRRATPEKIDEVVTKVTKRTFPTLIA